MPINANDKKANKQRLERERLKGPGVVVVRVV
jgi:hypothetical protein